MDRNKRPILCITAIFTFSAIGSAYEQPQIDGPKFDVASIKRNLSSANLVHYQPAPGGRFNAENITIHFLIQKAYSLQGFQIAGGPEWLKTERYDIAARAEGNPDSRLVTGPMLQALLADRCKLAVHKETRSLPVYTLNVAKRGPKLQPSKEGGCVHWSPDIPVIVKPGERPNFCGFRGIGYEGVERKLEMNGVSMIELGTALAIELRQAVIDTTALSGRFDIRLTWTPDMAVGAVEKTSPSIFTALQEQLGLKLDAGEGPVEVLVIDRVDRPSAN